jgi:hypothetical protein
MSVPRDKKLYDNVKKNVYKNMPTHSAYRSGHLVKKYKEEYEKKYNSKDAYEGKKKQTTPLKRWMSEVWRNQRGEVGYKKKGDIYRPTKKISSKTPKTFKQLSKEDISKAMKEKKKYGRVKKF